MRGMRIAITGSSGLIGSALVAGLRRDGHEVLRLVRRAPAADGEIRWDPRAPRGGLGPGSLAGVEAVINLAGAGVGDRRWTAAYRAEIRRSRLAATSALVAALTAAGPPPAVLLQGSAIGWYGDTGGSAVDESAPCGTGFLAELVRDWEAAAAPARDAGIRVVSLRTGVVLSARGGALARMLVPFRLGLGGRLGPGNQVMSWITLADLTAIAAFLLAAPGLSGPVNVTTPSPVTNQELTSALAVVLHRPAVLAVPAPALRLAVGGAASELLSSARVLPRKLVSAGYEYRYPEIRQALQAVLAGRA